MHLLPQRRHRKASPEPEAQRLFTSSRPNINNLQNIADSANSNSPNPAASGGISSYFATARRRWGSITRDVGDYSGSSTLLPTTYSSAAIPPKRSHHLPTSRTCNNFLMGGNYYPGKDKKRRNMRRRTLWYKIFCSTPWRKVSSTLLISYIIVWHILVPATEWILQVGSDLSSNSASAKHPLGDWLQYDATLVVPSLSEERKVVIRATSERARLQFGPERRHEKRLFLLERIAPIWFHRNDHGENLHKDSPNSHVEKPDVNAREQHEIGIGPSDKVANQQGNRKASGKHDSADAANKSSEKVNGGQGDSGSQKGTPGELSPGNRNNQVVQARPESIPRSQRKNNLADSATSRIPLITGNHVPFRTLQTMDSLVGTNYSSCPSQNPDSKFQTSLVIQSSIDRLWILKETCSRWKDPIIAVVFLPAEVNHDQQSLLQEFSSKNNCPNLQLIQYIGSKEESELAQYPVNRLRNVGLDAVRTTHILVVDVDFLPSSGLDNLIKAAWVKQKQQELPLELNRLALVVPAFERKPPKPCETDRECAAYLRESNSFIPRTFAELEQCYKSKNCIPFQSDVNWEGHYSTRSDEWREKKWYEDEDRKRIRRLECFHSTRYEPYVVLRWCPQSSLNKSEPAAPYYDERFHGYGKNKIELVSHLRFAGYQFSILPEGFIVHNPHPESTVKHLWNDRDRSDLHRKMDDLYPQFLSELNEKYNHISDKTVPPCKNTRGEGHANR